jgi:hypothetical protein
VVEGDINAKWQLNVGGVMVLPLGILAGVNVFERQGFPILYSVDAVANTDTRGSVISSLLIGSATDYRTPNVYQVDLQISRDFAVGRGVVISPTIAFFNLLDSHTVLGRDGYTGYYDTSDPSGAFHPADPSSFNAVADQLGPRTIRGGVRISF